MYGWERLYFLYYYYLLNGGIKSELLVLENSEKRITLNHFSVIG